MKSKVKIESHELDDLVFCSFRYALGRSTYVTFLVADLIWKYSESLSDNILDKVIDEIDIAIEGKRAGHDSVDVPMWQELALNLFEERQHRENTLNKKQGKNRTKGNSRDSTEVLS